MQVTSLHTYPVKSMAAVSQRILDVEPGGPVGDRRWAVVDARTGEKVTAREEPGMLHLAASTTEDGVRVETRDGRALDVAYPLDGRRVTTTFSRLSHALDAGDEAAGLLSAELGRPLRLVWQASVTDRSIRLDLGGLAGEPLSLADAGPLLLTSETSLAQLQEWVGPEPDLAMARFRPNVVDRRGRAVRGGHLGPGPPGRRRPPGAADLRPVRADDDRPRVPREGEGADPHPLPAPEVGRGGVVRRVAGAA